MVSVVGWLEKSLYLLADLFFVALEDGLIQRERRYIGFDRAFRWKCFFDPREISSKAV